MGSPSGSREYRCRARGPGSLARPYRRPYDPRARPPRSVPMRRFAAVGAMLASVLVAAPARAAEDPLVIGVVLPMSGDNATFGQESWDGIQIAAKELQAKDKSF